MIFTIHTDDAINCIDWCDIADEEVSLGILKRWPQDGYWRFTPLPNRPITAGSAKSIFTKLSDLNAYQVSKSL